MLHGLLLFGKKKKKTKKKKKNQPRIVEKIYQNLPKSTKIYQNLPKSAGEILPPAGICLEFAGGIFIWMDLEWTSLKAGWMQGESKNVWVRQKKERDEWGGGGGLERLLEGGEGGGGNVGDIFFLKEGRRSFLFLPLGVSIFHSLMLFDVRLRHLWDVIDDQK